MGIIQMQIFPKPNPKVAETRSKNLQIMKYGDFPLIHHSVTKLITLQASNQIYIIIHMWVSDWNEMKVK